VRAEINRRVRPADRWRPAVGSRPGGRPRPVAVLAAAACAAAAVAVPVAVLRPDGAARPVAGTTAATASTAPAEGIVFNPLAVSFTVGVLPAGWVGPGDLSAGPGYAARSFSSPNAVGWLVVKLWDPSNIPSCGGSRFGCGRSGKLWDPSNIPTLGEAWWVAPPNPRISRKIGSLVLDVDGSGDVDSVVLNRVARSIDLHRAEPLTFPFRLTHLPPGVAPLAADRLVVRSRSANRDDQHPRLTRYDPPLLLASLSLDDRPGTSVQDPWLGIAVQTSDQVGGPITGTPNTTVLGRPARYDADRNGLTYLQVFNLHGLHVAIHVYPAGHAGVDRAEMVRILEGMRLVPNPTQLSSWTNPLG
jgi:hypothetical protein